MPIEFEKPAIVDPEIVTWIKDRFWDATYRVFVSHSSREAATVAKGERQGHLPDGRFLRADWQSPRASERTPGTYFITVETPKAEG